MSFRKCVIVLVAIAVMSVAEARAAITKTLDDWLAAPVTVGDKTFTLKSFSAGFDGSLDEVRFSQVGSKYLVRFTPNDPLTDGSFLLNYWVSVSPSVPLNYISRVYLDSDLDGTQSPPALWTVTKKLYADEGATVSIGTIVINQGSVRPLDIPVPLSKFINVVDTWALDADTILVSTTNTFDQTVVPEPASLLIWGGIGVFGAGAVAAARRRRSRWSEENRQAIYGAIHHG